MAEEKYDVAKDPGQSTIRFICADPSIDFACERLVAGIESFCNGRLIVDELPEEELENLDDEEELPDRLDPLFDADDFPQPFVSLVYENVKDIFNPTNDVEIIEFVFKCVFSIIFFWPQTLQSNIDQLSTILSTQSEPFNKLNLKLLCLLFNAIPADNPLRCVVMQRMLNLAKDMKATMCQEQFRGQLNGLEEYIETEWQQRLSVQDKKMLYQTASVVAKKAAEKELYLKYLISYLTLFDESEDNMKSNESVADDAAQAIIAAISSADFNTKYVMQLIRSNIVRNVIQNTPKYMELYKLLDIVYQGNVNDFEAFYAQNTEKMEELGLNHTDLQRKMRLLTLCSMGGHTYSFDEMKDKLQVKTQNELEQLIVMGMKEKLCFAKVDYACSEVDVTRARQRAFDQNSWTQLSKKLSLWRHNTNTVLQIIHNAGENRWRQQYIQEMTKLQAQQQQ